MGFAALLPVLGVLRAAARALDESRSVLAVVGSNLSDDEKEQRLRRQALVLFSLFAKLGAGSAIALGVPLAAVYGLGRLGLWSFEAVVEVCMSWPFIALCSLGVVCALWATRRRRA
jgi:hypothetical protein